MTAALQIYNNCGIDAYFEYMHDHNYIIENSSFFNAISALEKLNYQDLNRLLITDEPGFAAKSMYGIYATIITNSYYPAIKVLLETKRTVYFENIRFLLGCVERNNIELFNKIAHNTKIDDPTHLALLIVATKYENCNIVDFHYKEFLYGIYGLSENKNHMKRVINYLFSNKNITSKRITFNDGNSISYDTKLALYDVLETYTKLNREDLLNMLSNLLLRD